MSDTPNVTSTLAELERKLRELERELSSFEQRSSPAPPAPAPAGRLIDEDVEYEPLQRPAPSDAQLAGLAELRRFRDRLERFAGELTGEYDALLSRVMSSFAARGPEAEDRGADPDALARAQRPTPPAPPAKPVLPHQDTLFEGRVELGVGPFYDVASLGSFERRLAELPYVGDVAVRRFEASHAVIDIRLAEPVPLVSELRRVLEMDFGVRQIAAGRLLLTFDES